MCLDGNRLFDGNSGIMYVEFGLMCEEFGSGLGMIGLGV